jgi:glycosyltransferase involved in cell wall biosynthesis
MGGAAKFMGELQRYLIRTKRADIRLIGQGRQLGPIWLAQREWSGRQAPLRIALNNVGFINERGSNATLLRNALHFAEPSELEMLGYRPSRSLILQTRIVRAAARRSDILVVPCAAMAERVARCEPKLRSRIVVRPHPVTQSEWAGNRAIDEGVILIPILNAPYKRLETHVANVLKASECIPGLPVKVRITARAIDFSYQIAVDPRVDFMGPLSRSELESSWEHAAAIYFPTQVESFGYPLAEARANGIPVIALETKQNREIAGDALRGFDLEDSSSLQDAILRSLTRPQPPDPQPFDPDQYFDWLFESVA